MKPIISISPWDGRKEKKKKVKQKRYNIR